MEEEIKRKIGETNSKLMKEYWKNHNPTKKQLEFQKKGISKRCKNCGIIVYNKNIRHICQEIKLKSALSRRGLKHSLEHNENIKKSNLGKHKKGIPLPLDLRLRISKSKQKEGFIPFKQKLIRRIRLNNKYLEWRSNVLKRDNYHCQNCGKQGYLEVHHIVAFSYLLSICNINNIEQALNCKVLWDEGNGITYCRDCHILLDKKIGKKMEVKRV